MADINNDDNEAVVINNNNPVENPSIEALRGLPLLPRANFGGGNNYVQPADPQHLNLDLSVAVLEAVAAVPSRRHYGGIRNARMNLLDHEREWALNVKAAIEGTPELDNLSDYMYAQLALVEEHNVQQALEKARGLQHFREEYGIVDSCVQGQSFLRALIQLFPKCFLSYSYNERDGINVLIADLAEFDMAPLSNPEKLRSWLGGCFYLSQAMNCDFEDIRRGHSTILECEGYTWGRGVNFSALKTMYTELVNVYPYKVNQVKHFHTGVIFNSVASMLKRLLPLHIQQVFQLGCEFDVRLSTIYMSPSVDHSNQRLLERVTTCLRLRYEHESTFRL